MSLCDDDGVTPLHDAAGRNAVDAVELLLRYGASAAAPDALGP